MTAFCRCFFKVLLSVFLILLGMVVMVRPSFAVDWLSQTPSAREETQAARLKGTGYAARPELYIRLFKQEKLLEVWIKGKGGYKLYKSYDICRYSGELGPKLAEGDRQAPEGFYHIPAEDIGWNSTKWPRALNLSFPNIYDALKERTGSFLLIHGGCSSKGCFALEDGPMEELYALVSHAVRQGQKIIPVHIFPFRMTEKNWEAQKGELWAPFWERLKPVYEHFNKSRDLPTILVCESGYKVMSFLPFADPSELVSGMCLQPLPLMSEVSGPHEKLAWVTSLKQRYKTILPKKAAAGPGAGRIKVSCNLKLPSCKRWLALRRRMLQKGTLPKRLLKQ